MSDCASGWLESLGNNNRLKLYGTAGWKEVIPYAWREVADDLIIEHLCYPNRPA